MAELGKAIGPVSSRRSRNRIRISRDPVEFIMLEKGFMKASENYTYSGENNRCGPQGILKINATGDT